VKIGESKSPEGAFVATKSCNFCCCCSHHAEGLVDPNLMYKKTVTGFRYPRACRYRKYQFENVAKIG
jgi:hypothetical protein